MGLMVVNTTHGVVLVTSNQLVPTRFPVGVRATLPRVVRPQIDDHGIGTKRQRRLERWQTLVDANADDGLNLNVVARIKKLMDRRSSKDRNRVPSNTTLGLLAPWLPPPKRMIAKASNHFTRWGA